MGLLSIFQKRETAAPRTSPVVSSQSAGLCRKTDFSVYPLGNGVHAAYLRTGPPRTLPSFAVEFALSCEQFRPIDEHVAEYAERHGWDALQIDTLEQQIEELFHGGLLVTDRQLLTRFQSPASNEPPPASISSIGFPTGGDRMALTRRAIESFAQNLRSHGRHAELLISDNSIEPAHRDGFRSLAATLTHELGAPILIASEDEKRRFATEIARRADCPPAILEFALFDPHGIRFACGANRNAILLHGAGRMLYSVDDDVVCRISASPERASASVACFSDEDPFSRWLFAHGEPLGEFAPESARDLLGASEAVLGRAAAAILANVDVAEIDLSRTGDGLLRRLDHSNGLRIRAVFPGHAGDPGIPASVYYLDYDGENRARLTETGERYHSVFGSRNVRSVVPALALGDASVCPGMAMGLDHRELLPPFFPVLHAEDFSFGAALWQCCPDALVGHLPFTVDHAPPAGKPILTPADLSRDTSPVFFEFAHLLRQMLLSFAPPESGTTAERMQATGRQFAEWAGWSQRDFDQVVREFALTHASGRIEHLSRKLDEADAPDYWKRDVEHVIDCLRTAVTHDDFDVPLDLRGSRSASQNRALMRALIGDYGKLLQHWPAIVAAARDLRENGMPLFR